MDQCGNAIWNLTTRLHTLRSECICLLNQRVRSARWHREFEWTNERTSKRTNERMNERMNLITYISPVKPEGQAHGCILRQSMVSIRQSIRQWQSGKDVGNYSTSREVKTWFILAQVITGDFFCFSHESNGVNRATHQKQCLDSFICRRQHNTTDGHQEKFAVLTLGNLELYMGRGSTSLHANWKSGAWTSRNATYK